MILTRSLRPLGLLLAASGALTLAAQAGSGFDKFDRPNSSTPGPAWTVTPGSNISINNHRVKGRGAGLRDSMLWTGASEENPIMEIDVIGAGTRLKFVALISRVQSPTNCVFVKVQDNDSDGTYETAYFYSAYDGNLTNSFHPLTVFTPFTSARIRTVLNGSNVRLEIDRNFDGTPDEVIESNAAPITGGTGLGVELYGTAEADNFSFNRSIPTHAVQALYTVGTDVPGAGVEARIQTGAKWSGFGTPAVNGTGRVAYLGKWKAPAAKTPVVLKAQSGAGIFLDGELQLKVGDPVPGIAGTVFKSFKDPVIDDQGHLAFVAAIKGETTATVVPASADTVIVTNSRVSGYEVIAREGTPAPYGEGATYKAFSSVSIKAPQIILAREPRIVPPMEQSQATVLFTASLNQGGSVTPANDLGAWILPFGGSDVLKLVRESDALGDTVVRNFNLLKPIAGSPGVGRGIFGDSSLHFQATLGTPAGPRQALLLYENGSLSETLRVGDDFPSDQLPPGVTAKWTKLAAPSRQESGLLTFNGTLKLSTGLNSLLLTQIENDGTVALTAAQGNAMPIGPVSGQTFHSFKDPVNSPTNGDFAFPALTYTNPTAPKIPGLFYQPAGAPFSYYIASAGQPAPVQAEGALWKSFSSLAVSGGPAGTLFTALLQKGQGALPGPGGITGADDFGFFRYDADEQTVGELLREGQPLRLSSGETKTVKSFNVLKAASGSSGNTRAFNESRVVLLVTFTDKTTSIVAIDFESGMPE